MGVPVKETGGTLWDQDVLELDRVVTSGCDAALLRGVTLVTG